MTPTDEIEPMVPELPRQMLTDGGERSSATRTSSDRRSDSGARRTRTTRKTFDDPEDDAPLVPDLS